MTELTFAHSPVSISGCRQPLNIDNKADNSPVTEADRKAERAMRDIITDRYPDHGIFGEEEGMKQPKTGDDQYLWVLDPIDGTKSFITGGNAYHCLLSLLILTNNHANNTN